MSWTDEKVKELARLWENGLTTGEIGKQLGVSKNAVVGKAHRLGLAGRPSPIKRVDGEADDIVVDIAPPVKTKPAKRVEKPAARSAKAQAKQSEPKETAPERASARKSREKPAVAGETPASRPAKAAVSAVTEKKRTSSIKAADMRITSVIDLSAQTCRWPIGDPKKPGFHFCGRRAIPGKPYCPEHAAIAYVSGGKSRDEDAA